MTGSEGRSADREDDVAERLSHALDVLREGRANAVLAWAIVGVYGLVFVESALTRDLELLAIVAVTGAIALVPPVGYCDWRVMLPFELLALASLPILVRGLFGGDVGTFATFLAVAALALLLTVELHTFTALELTHWFAVTFVVMATLAWAGAVTVLRWTLDRYAGTAYLSDNVALMDQFVWATLAGLAAGVLFDAYFRRRDRQLRSAIARVILR